jgi:hypothetical protein
MFCHPDLYIRTSTQLEAVALGLDHANVVAITEGPDVRSSIHAHAGWLNNPLVTIWKHLDLHAQAPLRLPPNDPYARKVHRQNTL